jgi:hypothetical protein
MARRSGKLNFQNLMEKNKLEIMNNKNLIEQIDNKVDLRIQKRFTEKITK